LEECFIAWSRKKTGERRSKHGEGWKKWEFGNAKYALRIEAAAPRMTLWKGYHSGTSCGNMLIEDLKRDEKEYEGDYRFSLSLY
jgi:hypothetical protein